MFQNAQLCWAFRTYVGICLDALELGIEMPNYVGHLELAGRGCLEQHPRPANSSIRAQGIYSRRSKFLKPQFLEAQGIP